MSGRLVKDEESVRRIWFNRPQKLNAITREDMAEMRALVDEAREVAEALVIGGIGDRAFSAGVHIEEFLGLSAAEARELICELKSLLEAVRRASIPTVCAVNGYCLGGAMELAMTCDVRVVARHARFGMPEIKLGIPSVLDAALLEQHVGLSMAKEMLLTGDTYGTGELESCGLLNKVVEAEALEEEVDGFLSRLTPHRSGAIAAQKRLFESWQNTGLEESIAASVNEFALAFAEEQTQETIREYAAGLKDRG